VPGFLITFGLVALLVAIKVVVLFLIANWVGLKKKTGIAISLILAQGGEFAMVIFSLAFQSDLI